MSTRWEYVALPDYNSQFIMVLCLCTCALHCIIWDEIEIDNHEIKEPKNKHYERIYKFVDWWAR